ncbi:HNH endonuclease [Niallia oryzisoli]|uniref:HNH endonuclease n=1 Tax=Niallia oryzisoli TaxID=1737571 RepID=UPI003BB062DC
MSNALETKRCSKCQQVLSVEEFYGQERSQCKACEKSQKKEYNATFRGKAAQALNDSRKAVRRVEVEYGVKVEDTLTLHDVLWVLSADECVYCGREVPESERSLDHITPIRYGGSNSFSNVTCACRACNSAKCDLPAITYMLQSCDTLQARTLIEVISSRSVKPFEETFRELAEHAKTYYETKAAEAVERAKQNEQ